jgi:DNA polymerase-3 subunit beta
MKIKSTRDELLKALQITQGVISTRTTLPILSYILLTAKTKTLSLFSTDLEVGVKCILPGEIAEDGVVALPGRRISELIREFPSGTVEISSQENITTIKCPKTRVKINTLPPEDFPNFPEIVGQKISIKGDLLKSMIQKTILAVSQEESRYTLTGVYMMLKEGSIEMVGTDGRRLSLVEESIGKKEVKQKKGCILPTKTCNELIRIMGDDEITLTLGEKQVNFVQKEVSLTSRLIEGDFPDYNRVIPKNFQQKLMINKQEIKDAITRAYVLTKEKGGSVKFEVQKDSMVISAKVPEVGESSEEIPVKHGEKEMKIAFDPEYTLDALKVIDSEEVFLGLNSSKEAALLRPMDNEKFVYVVMPMEM